MHAEHVQGERVCRIARAKRHQRRRDRNPVLVCEAPHGFRGVGIDDAATRVDQRALGLGQHRVEPLALRVTQLIGCHSRKPAAIAVQREHAHTFERTFPVLDIFRDVHDNRAGPTGTCQLEGAANRVLERVRVGDKEYVLGHGAHDGGDGRFLECVGADSGSRHLPADHDQGNRVRHAVANRRDRVRSSGARRHHDHSDFAAGACVAGCHEASSLFVGRHDQLHRWLGVGLGVVVVVSEHRIINRQDGTAGVPEDRIDAFVCEYLHHGIGAGQRFACQWMRGVLQGIGLFVHGIRKKLISAGFFSSVY